MLNLLWYSTIFMSRKAIFFIMFLMSAAVLGVSAIQFFWIKEALNLKEKTFDDRIFLILNKAKDRLQEDIQSDMQITDELKEKIVTEDVWKQRQVENELKKTLFLTDSHAIENISFNNIEALDSYFKNEFNSQGIDLKFEYGIYSKKTESFIIRDGHFVVEFDNKKSASTIINEVGLENTVFSVQLFDGVTQEEPGLLKIYFPSKSKFLWRNLINILLSSILFTSLILFCFAYTIYVIFQQKKVSEIRNDFINNMTHEFKTPIATISLASDSITNANIIKDETKIRRFVGIIKSENKRMLSQVEKVLQMAQIDRKDVALKKVTVDINELAKIAAENAELKINNRGGEIELILNAKRSTVEADQTHVSNIMANLLDNAEKYTIDTPKIVIETQDDKDGVKFMISDNGVGIPKDSLKMIFDKFFRVHTGNLHDVKGFGLGLSYVKALVDAHGGRVTVRSELGKGSIFTVFLPFRSYLSKFS